MKHNAKKGFGMFEGNQWDAFKHTKTFVSTCGGGGGWFDIV